MGIEVGETGLNIIELFHLKESLGRDEFMGKMTAEIKAGKWDIFRSEAFRLDAMETAMGFKDFSILVGTQSEYTLKRAYRDTPAPMAALFDKVPSSGQTEEYVEIPPEALPKKIEPGNPADRYQLTDSSGTITNYKYGRRVTIEEEIVKFDKKGTLLKRLINLGRGMRNFEEKMRTICFADINSNAYLGSALYSETSGYGYNLRTGVASAFSVDALEERDRFMTDQVQPGVDSIPAGMFPKFVVFPTDLKSAVLRIIKAGNNVADTAEYGYNWIKDLSLVPILNQWLKVVDTSAYKTKSWYLAAPVTDNGLVEQVVWEMRTTSIIGTPELQIQHLYLDMDVSIMKGWGAIDFRGISKARGQ